jgi:hypothetical protein
LNNHYANLQSPYADKIQATTAELMLKKNMMNLSKIAFGQESKKKFEDGFHTGYVLKIKYNIIIFLTNRYFKIFKKLTSVQGLFFCQ